MNDSRHGVGAAFLAYVMWGFMPAYLRLLHGVAPLEVVAHRAIWSCVFLCGVVSVRGSWSELRAALPGALGGFALSACLLSLNWSLYVVAVVSNRVVDASLGYFINPMFNVVLGVLAFQERLRFRQWLAVAVAGLGVLWLIAVAGSIPWFGLTIAVSFSLYGYFRKAAQLGALHGLLLETLIVLPFALLLLAFHSSTLPFSGAHPWGESALLCLSGLVTAVPLWLFSYAARRVPLSLLGIVQYISPSIQFALGVFAWSEPFSRMKLVGFALIWLAVAGYALEGFWTRRRVTNPAEISG
jgi:chloramphenicol-sensitive protein RarD